MTERYVCRCHLRKYRLHVCACHCPDCGRSTRVWPVYMVLDSIWDHVIKSSLSLQPQHHVCPSCLEQRIDQRLSKTLLTPAPCNVEFWTWWERMATTFRDEQVLAMEAELMDVVFM